MTALVVLDHLPLDHWVTISPRVEHLEASKLYLRGGERLVVRDLLKALLMNSANDAATALAVETAGSELRFSELMNEKARLLGARNTRFRNASGLPAEGQYSTAYDMALIMREAMSRAIISSILKQKHALIRTEGGRRFTLKNHNKMLWSRAPVVGKTGYTRRARHCFVGYVGYGYKTAIVAVLGSRRLWRDLNLLCRRHIGFRKPNVAILSFGSRGNDVMRLQHALKRAGYFPSRVTGYFGARTTQSVIEFQKANGLRADAKVGPATRKALTRYL